MQHHRGTVQDQDKAGFVQYSEKRGRFFTEILINSWAEIPSNNIVALLYATELDLALFRAKYLVIWGGGWEKLILELLEFGILLFVFLLPRHSPPQRERQARACFCSHCQPSCLAGWWLLVPARLCWHLAQSAESVPASRLLALSNIVTLWWIAQRVMLATLEWLSLQVITWFAIVYFFMCKSWKNSDIHKRLNGNLPCAFALITFLPWFL